MAQIKGISFDEDGVVLTIRASKREYELIKDAQGEYVLLPVDESSLDEVLTSGKLGTGNRIMMPNKLLAKHNVKRLLKKLPARVFETEENKLLLIRLEGSKLVPDFEGEEKVEK